MDERSARVESLVALVLVPNDDGELEADDRSNLKLATKGSYIVFPEPCLQELDYLVSKSPVLRQRALVSTLKHLVQSPHSLVSGLRGEKTFASKRRPTLTYNHTLSISHIQTLVSLAIGHNYSRLSSVVGPLADSFISHPQLWLNLLPNLPLDLALDMVKHIVFASTLNGTCQACSQLTLDLLVQAALDRIKAAETWSCDSSMLNHAMRTLVEMKVQLSDAGSIVSIIDYSLGESRLQMAESVLKEMEHHFERLSGRVEGQRMTIETYPTETSSEISGADDSVHVDPSWVNEILSSSYRPIEDVNQADYASSLSSNQAIWATIFSSNIDGPSLHLHQLSVLVDFSTSNPKEASKLDKKNGSQFAWNAICQRFINRPSFRWTWPAIVSSLAETSVETRGLSSSSDMAAFVLTRLMLQHNMDLLIILRLISTLLDSSSSHSLQPGIPSSLGFLFIQSVRSHLSKESWSDEMLVEQIFETVLSIHASAECQGPCCVPPRLYSISNSPMSEFMGWLIQHALQSGISLSVLVEASLDAESAHVGAKYFSWYWSELLVALMVHWSRIPPHKELGMSFSCLRLLPSNQDSQSNQEEAQMIFEEVWGDLRETFIGSIVLGADREHIIVCIQKSVSSFFASLSDFQRHFPEQTISLSSSSMISHIIQLADLRDRYSHLLIPDSAPIKLPFWQRIFGRVMDGVSSSDLVDLTRLLHYHRQSAQPRFWLRGQWISWIMSSLQHVRHSKNIIGIIQNRLPFEPRRFVEEVAQMAHSKIQSDESSFAPLTTHQSIARTPSSLRPIHEELKKLLKMFTRTHAALVLPKWGKARPIRINPKDSSAAVDDGLNAGIRLLTKMVGVIESSYGTRSLNKTLPSREIIFELDATNSTGENAEILDHLTLALTIYSPVELWRHTQSDIGIGQSEPQFGSFDPNDPSFRAFRKSVAFVAASIAQFLPHYRPAANAAVAPVSLLIRNHLLRLTTSDRSDASTVSSVALLDDEQSIHQLTDSITDAILMWLDAEPTACIPDLFGLWTSIGNAICKSAGKGHLLVLLALCSRLRIWCVPGLLESVAADRLTQINTQSLSSASDFRLIFALVKLIEDQDFPIFVPLVLDPLVLRSFFIPIYSRHHDRYAAPTQLLLHLMLEHNDPNLKRQIYEIPYLRERFLWLICRQQEETVLSHVFNCWVASLKALELAFQRNQSKIHAGKDRFTTLLPPILMSPTRTEWSKLLKGIAGWDSGMIEESIVAQTRLLLEEDLQRFSAHEWDQALHPGVSLLELRPKALGGSITWKTNVPFPVFLEWELEASLALRTSSVDSSAYANHLMATVMCQVAVFPFERTSQLLTSMINAVSPFPNEPILVRPRSLPAPWNAIWKQACGLCLRLNPMWLMDMLIQLPSELPFIRKLCPDPLTGTSQQDLEASQNTLRLFERTHFISSLVHLLQELISPHQLIPILPSFSSPQSGLLPRIQTLLGHPLLFTFDSFMGWIWGEIIAHIEAIQHSAAVRDFFLGELLSFVSKDPPLLSSFSQHWFQAFAPHFVRSNPSLVEVLGAFFARFPSPSGLEVTHRFESVLTEASTKKHDAVLASYFASPVLNEMETLFTRQASLSPGWFSKTGPLASPSYVNSKPETSVPEIHTKPADPSLMAAASIASVADISSPVVPVHALRAPSKTGFSTFRPPKDVQIPNVPKTEGSVVTTTIAPKIGGSLSSSGLATPSTHPALSSNGSLPIHSPRVINVVTHPLDEVVVLKSIHPPSPPHLPPVEPGMNQKPRAKAKAKRSGDGDSDSDYEFAPDPKKAKKK